VDLSAYQTSTDLMIAFRNHGHYGQALYVDNINLNVPNSVAEHHLDGNFAMLAPNPVRAGSGLQLLSNAGETFTVELFDMNGQLLLREQHHRNDIIPLSTSFAPGTYFYRLTSESMIRNGKFIVQ
jgi:hypothetical protein